MIFRILGIRRKKGFYDAWCDKVIESLEESKKAFV